LIIGRAPVAGLLQAVVGTGQLQERDARTGDLGWLPVRIGGSANEQRGLARFADCGHDGCSLSSGVSQTPGKPLSTAQGRAGVPKDLATISTG
jgi:hypothetical protein